MNIILKSTFVINKDKPKKCNNGKMSFDERIGHKALDAESPFLPIKKGNALY
jgi:hypothetical protein